MESTVSSILCKGDDTRRRLLAALEKELGHPVVAYIANPNASPNFIDHSDARPSDDRHRKQGNRILEEIRTRLAITIHVEGLQRQGRTGCQSPVGQQTMVVTRETNWYS